MGGDRNDKRSRGHGGAKRKYVQAFGGDKSVAIPYGKQGILVTLLSPNLNRAGREAINVFTEAWEELIAKGVKQGPFIAPALPKAEPATDAQPDTDAAKPPAADTNESEQPPTKATRSDPGTAAKDTAGGAAAAADGGGEGVSDGDGGGGDALDFSKMISSEVKDLKDVKKQPFVVHDTGIKTCMFIGMPLAGADMPGPCEVVKHVLRKAKETRVLRLRHCLRLLPCTHVVRSQPAEIDAAAKAAIAMAIDCSAGAEPLTTAVLYEHRAAPAGVVRAEAIDSAIAHVPRPPHSVKLKGAAKTISLQVMRNSCGVAVLDDYDELKKYNIKTLCQDPEEDKDKPVAKTGDGKAADAKEAKQDVKAAGDSKAADAKEATAKAAEDKPAEAK